MVQTNNRLIELPDRKEITLCAAVTAFIYGKAYDLREFDRVRSDEVPIKERAAKLNDFLEQLREAAYSGRIKFRAVKEGEDDADGYKDIDPLYFYIKPFFNWTQDVIFRPEDETSTPWYFVHLDRGQFATLLRDMDVAAQQDQDADLTSRTGTAGRPGSIHLVMPEAQRRLDTENHPKNLTAFSKELADWFSLTKTSAAAPLKPRSIENAIRERWRAHGRKCTK
jgi:hypothetical protein